MRQVESEERTFDLADATYLVVRIGVASLMAFMQWWWVNQLPSATDRDLHFAGSALWVLGTVVTVAAVLVWPRIDMSKALVLTLPTDLIALAVLTAAVGGYEDPYYALFFAGAVIHAVRSGLPQRWMGASLLALSYVLGHVMAGHVLVEPATYPFLLAKVGILVAFAWVLGRIIGEQTERAFSAEMESEQVEALNAQLERRVMEMEAVAQVSDMLHSTLDVDSVGGDVLDVVMRLLGWDAMSAFVVDASTNETVFSATRGTPSKRPASVYASGEALLESDGSEGSFACFDVLEYHNLRVVICAQQRLIDSLDENDRRVLQAVSAELAVAVENAQLYRLTRRLANTDELTGLYNYRYLQQRLDEEISRARRYDKTLSFLMIDVDDFKRINDTHGHLVGDSVLRELGAIMKSTVREVDVVVRYGGEEFSVILPETDAAGAFIVAEKIRENVAMHRFKDEDGEPSIHVTISVGVANMPVHADDKESLLRAADDAVYYAKESGKDRVRAPRIRLTRFGRPVAAPPSTGGNGVDA
jgi:diguanylate cyclase (GGDEF)-like protein